MKHSTKSLGIALIFLGTWLGFYGWRQHPLLEAARMDPRRTSLRELLASDAQSSPRVLLTDFVFCREYAVLAGSDGRTRKTWIPVVAPTETERPPVDAVRANAVNVAPSSGARGLHKRSSGRGTPEAIRVLVASSRLADQAAVERFCEQAAVTGVLVNRLGTMPEAESTALKDAFPRLDPASCIIIEEDWPGPSWLGFWGVLAGAALVIGSGIYCLVRDFWPAKRAKPRDHGKVLDGWLVHQDEHLKSRPS